MLITTAIILFLIFLLIRPTVYLSKQSGFPKNEAVKYEKGKIRFIVPESADITNHTLIAIKLNWFTANRLGSVINIQPKQGKVLALDFNNRKYDEVIFELTVKNLFGIKTKYDVIIDYSNYLRIFFPENHVGETRKPIVLPYYKMDHEFRHIKEELYKIESFFRFDENGKPETKPIAKSVVFSKIEAKGHAFLVNNTNHITVYYDFVLPGIFENQSQKTFILNYISRSQKTLKTLNPTDINLRLKFKQAPFYVSEFLGWFYYDQAGKRVNVGIGEEINIPAWIKYEFRLIARYKYEIEDQVGDEINKKGYVAISYFDGPERIHFEIIKKGTPVYNFIPNKPGFEIQGWYLDEALTQAYDFTPGKNVATKNLSLYLKSKKVSEPIKTHRITFITPPYAIQLVPVFRAHGEKLDLNYSLPSMVTGYKNGQFSELDYWTIVDPVSGRDTGKRFDFKTPITSDLTLKAHMRELKFPTPDREVNFRIIDSVDGKVLYEKRLTLKDNKIQDKDKTEISQILAKKPSDKNHLLGKFTFNDWYLNADLRTKFDVNQPVQSGVSELNVFGLYNFKSSSNIPDPTNPTDPKPTDPTLIKVTFLSDTSSILSVQTNPKNETFKGTLPAISKSGYRFKHWAYFKNNQISGQFNLNDVLTEDITLYPIFEKDPSIPTPDTTVVVTIVNKLLGTKEIRLVKKGELLDLDPQQYNTKLGPYQYEFSRFTKSNGMTFDHLTERIFTNTTIYVEHTKIAKDQVNYQINHIFEGVGTIAERTITETKQALVDSRVTVSPSDKLSGYDHGFELETTQSETKQISSEYTTQFTLKYRRRKFDVNFETNFNNQFTGDVSPNSNQKVKYEGTATEPTTPTISSPGYKYTFVQWQLKSLMNGQYVKTQAYDFNVPVTGNVDLVAYFEKKKTVSTYTIKHIFQGISGEIDERVDEQKISAQVGKSITITHENRDKNYDEHYEVADFAETKKVLADESTTFEIRYARKSYTVTYEVNYNGNHFSGVTVGGQPQTQLIKYQGKAQIPATPTITKNGRTYTFVHWQLTSLMNGIYSQVAAFDFENTRITKDIKLTAYFNETIHKVNYNIVHYFEKQGPEHTLDSTFDKVVELKTDQLVENGAQYQAPSNLDTDLYEIDDSQTSRLNADLTKDNNDTEVYQYYRLKKNKVNFLKTPGIQSLDFEFTYVKKTRKIKTLPAYTLKDTHNFTGWSVNSNGPAQTDFVSPKLENQLNIYALTALQDRQIKYVIRKENIDKSFTETYEYKTAQINSLHRINFANPNPGVYTNPEITPSSLELIVSADQTQNIVTIVLKRKRHQVNFTFTGTHSNGPIYKQYLHEDTIKEVYDPATLPFGTVVSKLLLDGSEQTKTEIEQLKVVKTHNIEIQTKTMIDGVQKYPQTEVLLNSADIVGEISYAREVNFEADNNSNKFTFYRTIVKDKNNEIYEKINNKYFKFEEIEFISIPSKTTKITKKIIDYSVYNIHSEHKPNAEYNNSILKAIVDDIDKITGYNLHIPEFTSSGDFGIYQVWSNSSTKAQLIKQPTDYAKEIISIATNVDIHRPVYRGQSLLAFKPASAMLNDWMPLYSTKYSQFWWTKTKGDLPYPSKKIVNNEGDYYSNALYYVLGVVVAKY